MSKDLCRQYLAALNDGNLANVLDLFEPDAVVVSPLYGDMAVEAFYESLFSDTTQSKTELAEIFDAQSSNSIALQFTYEWTMKSGAIKTFNCVDVFDLNDDQTRFTKLSIIYDTAPLRDDFNSL